MRDERTIAIYVRVSTDDQQDRGTIESQIEFATKYCDLHKLNVTYWFKDDGVSGTLPLEQRQEGQELLNKAKNKEFDTLLIYKLDRLGRSARVVLNAVYELEQCGITVKSMTEPFDTSDASGRFLLTILAGVADLERSNILERTYLGSNRCAKQGQWLGGITPYGYYVTEDKYLAVNEAPLPNFSLSEADVVRMIYRMISEQKLSTIKIANHLNALGVPPSYVKDGRQISKGKRKQNTSGIWLPGRVRNMIVNETYKGIHRYGKRSNKPNREIIERQVPSIVSEETWDLAQMILHENQIEATCNSKYQYLLRGLIKCGQCSLTYSGTRYNPDTLYYVCNGKISYRGPSKGKCQSKNIPSKWVEELVWADCVKFIQTPDETIKLIQQSKADRETKKKNIVDEITLLTQAIGTKDAEKQSILDLFRKNLINYSDVAIQLQKITDEKAVLEKQLDTLQDELENKEISSSNLENAKAFLIEQNEKIKNGEPSYEEKREIIKTLVDKIVVDTEMNKKNKPTAKLTVHYIFSIGVSLTGKGS
ncbi:MAG: Resolvase protein [Firmicutes bacterium]|nr:Resolvase protein [Bacillota bacterium]